MALSADAAASYATIIDKILAASDLNTISAKRIRKSLQEQVDHDISAQKDAVTDLIMSRFDKVNAERNGAPDADVAQAVPTVEATEPVAPPPAAPANGTTKASSNPKKRSASDESDEQQQPSPSETQSPPPKKKHKRITSQSMEEDDAAYAARLQAELNRVNARSTRGGGATKKKPLPKKKEKGAKKKKSAAKVHSDDDSEVENGEKKSPNRTGGFHKPLTLSQPLSELLGETQLSRPQTVKKIWEYVKARDLQDPSDKRQIRCDEAMKAVFKTERVNMFTMNKILGQNLYRQEDE